MSIHDVYPSRTAPYPAILPRRDPVVYTDLERPTGPLSREQLAHYNARGYLVLPGMLSAQDVHAFQSELEALRHDDTIRASECAITEPDSDVVRSIFNVTALSHAFFALSRNSRIVDMVQQILGDDVYIHQSRVNFKPGFNGKEFQWHSDFETWHTEDGMPRMRAVSCSISLTENNEFNGPLMLIPGSHESFVACVGKSPEENYKHSLKKQVYGVPDAGSLHHLVEKGGLVSATGPAGSVLFFDCNTMHGSNSNISPYPRSNVFLVYNSVTNRLVQPFLQGTPRPEYIACRDFTPVAPIDVKPSYAAL
jgi:ectoine hydroxylase